MEKEQVKVGLIGLGCRGRGLLRTTLACEEATVVALCDLYEDRLETGKKIVEERRGITPKLYTDYKELIADPEVQAVVIVSSWDEHTRMAVESMRAGKYTGVEVAGAYDIEDCWQLVRTYEETKTPIMMLENCCFDKFELLSTSLVRSGALGKVLYCHGAYAHELRGEILGGYVNRHYRLRNYLFRNCDNYPTHSIGPIAKLLNINRGNKMLSLTSVASKGGVGLEEFAKDEKNPDPSLKDSKFAQGDIVMTTITCAGGEIINICLDTTLPRMYAREFTVRGTRGMCSQDTNTVLLEKDMDMHECYDTVKMTKKYTDSGNDYAQYLPSEWRDITPEEKALGHGGMDYLQLRTFYRAILNGEEMPIDVYDMATWMAITPLSEQSIAHGGMPQAIPDFTRGKWFLREPKDVLELPKIDEKTAESKTEFGHSRK